MPVREGANPGGPLRTVILHLRGIGDIAFAETGDQPASNDQKNAEGQEPEVIGRLMTGALADVVQAKNLMVNETLDEVEEAPADEHPSEQRLTADCPPPVRRPSPEKQDAGGNRHPGGGMEEAIGERVDLHASDSGLWVLPFAALCRRYGVPRLGTPYFHANEKKGSDERSHQFTG